MTTARSETGDEGPGETSRAGFYLLITALLVLLFNRRLAPRLEYDCLNVVALGAAIYVGYCLVALKKTCGRIPWVRRSLARTSSVSKPRGAFLVSPWLRSLLLLAVAALALEFGLRCCSYQRSLVYERQGDLLFTPVPNQEYVEKISLSHSHINRFGLRGGPVDTSPGVRTILCLGDSITYGYGLEDAHTYPARLQLALDRRQPRRYVVLNGGVDAYPVAFEHQKFLYLWNRGLRPDLVVVGYSMNEGWLGHLVDSDEEVKRQFTHRVWLKNRLRSWALYNLVVERWARTYYDRMKGKLVPGSNFVVLSPEDLDSRYEASLRRLVTDLRTRNVRPVFLLNCGFNGQTGRSDTEGPFATRFADFARSNGIPLLRSDDILRHGEPAGADLARYFIDQTHLSKLGTEKMAERLAEFLPGALEAQPPAR